MRVLAITAVALLIGAVSLTSQVPQRVKAGTRVRLTAPDCGLDNQTMTIANLSGDTLLFPRDSSRSGNPSICPLASVNKIEVRTRRNVSTGRVLGYAVVGGAIGTAVGTAIGYASCAPCDYELEAFAVLGGAAIGGGVGLVGGLVVGLLPSHHWEAIPVSRLRVNVAPRRDGQLTFSVSLSF